MTPLPFSFAESTAASAKRVASVDASLEALRAELLALQLPDAAGENGPESYERAVSSALNRTGCALLGAAIEELDECEDRVVLDGAVYYRAGKSAGEMMSSFGRVRYERSQYRRRNCGSVFPADARFGLIGEFWSPLAARQGSLGLALVPVKDCEGLFRGDAAVGDGAEQPRGDDGFGLGRCAGWRAEGNPDRGGHSCGGGDNGGCR